MNNLTKAAAAAVGLLTLSVAVVPVVSAQDLSFLPGFGRATAEQAQESIQSGQESPRGIMQGQMKKGPAGERGENFANLTFEEQQQRMLENLSRAQEQLSKRLETMDQNEFMSEDVKNQLQNLIDTHLNNMASYKSQVEAASNVDALTAIREQMREEAQEMHRFMKENRPTAEQMQAHWDSMSFEEKQERLLSRIDNSIENLNEVKTQVQSATSEQDLEALKGEIGHGPGKRQGPGRGSMQNGGIGQRLNQNTAE